MRSVGFVGRVGQPFPFLQADSGPAYSANFLTGTLPAGFTFTRASSATYFNSAGVRQVAAVDQPRFDYNPTTLQPLGYLCEGTRTNFLLNSLAPANQTTGSLSTGTYILWMEGTGSVLAVAGTAIGTFGSASAGAPATLTVTTAGTVNIVNTGSVTAFQLELGRFPSSLIITTGATATRADDSMILPVAAITGFSQSQGTIFSDYTHYGMTVSAPVNGQQIVNLNDGTTTANIVFFKNTTINQFRANVGGGTDSTSITITANTPYKAALGYLNGDNEAALNNALVGGAGFNASAVSGTRTQFMLGNRSDFARPFFGYFRSFSYYNTRLPNAQLQALTV